jgi:hypothetical protein
VVIAVLLVVVGPAGRPDRPQVINLRSCCIWLVNLVESMMMHGLANPKFEIQYFLICLPLSVSAAMKIVAIRNN